MAKNTIQFVLLSLLYSFLIIAYTWPVAKSPSTDFMGHTTNSDAVQYVWNAFIWNENIHQQKPLFSTLRITAPAKVNLLAHTYTPILNIFNQWCNQGIAGINFFLFISFLLSAIGAFILAKRYIKSNVLCFICGVLYALSPYKLLHASEHYHLLLTGVVPFYILFVLNGFTFIEGKIFPQKSSLKYILGCLFCGVISLLGDYYTTAYMLWFTFFYMLYFKIKGMPFMNHRTGKIFVVLCILIISNICVPVFFSLGWSDRAGVWWGASLLSFFIPDSQSIFYSERLARWASGYYPTTWEHQVFIGFFLSVLTIYFLIMRRKLTVNPELKVLTFSLLGLFVLCMPAIRIFHFREIYTPSALVHFIPGINQLRCPTRSMIIITLLLPLLTIKQFELLMEQYGSLLRKSILTGIVCILLMADTIPSPMPILSYKNIPHIYHQIKRQNIAGNLFTLPFGLRDGFREVGHVQVHDLWYQTLHQKNLIGGYYSRIPPDVFNYYEQDSVMVQLLQMMQDSLYIPRMVSKTEIDSFMKKFSPELLLITPEIRNPDFIIQFFQHWEGISMKKLVTEDGYKLFRISYGNVKEN